MINIQMQMDVRPYIELVYGIIEQAFNDIECIPKNYNKNPNTREIYDNALFFLTKRNGYGDNLCDMVDLDFNIIRKKAWEIHNRNLNKNNII